MFRGIKKLLKGLRKKSYPTYLSGMDVAQSPSFNTYPSINVFTGGLLEDKRIEKKPVEIVGEIVSEVPAIYTDALDKQIKIVQRRLRLLEETQGNTRDEILALAYLKARKQWKKLGPKFKWAITNQTKIQKLCTDYKVMLVSFNGYSRNVPNEALDEIESFLGLWEKVCKNPPQFQLIVDQGGKEMKKDPILLAPSPFGNWHYILGAWDQEVEIVDDLVYNGK